MSFIRHLPLKIRLPLIHGALDGLTRIYGAGWGEAADPAKLTPGPLVVSAFLDQDSGIGRAGRATLNALEAAGFSPLTTNLAEVPKRLLTQSAQIDIDAPGGVWLIHANAPECQAALLAHPMRQWRSRYRIAVWAWETPVMPRSWARTVAYFHEIWVPSHFVAEALTTALGDIGRADLRNRVRLMPHPVPVMPDLELTPETRRTTRLKFGLDPEAVEILSLFSVHSATARKNPWAVIEAWKRAFSHTGNGARLRLKVQNLATETGLKDKLMAAIGDRPDIGLMDTHLKDDEMHTFVAAFDGLISLHRAEGFGLALAEAMASGVAVIATNWSGNVDFMTPDTAWPVAYDLRPIEDRAGPYGVGGHDPRAFWAEPDIEDAGRALKEMVLDSSGRTRRTEAARQAIAALNRPWTSDNLSQMPFAAHIVGSQPRLN